MQKNARILLLDGISQIPVGRDIKDGFQLENYDVSYLDLKKIAKKSFYKLRRIFDKAVNYSRSNDEYYYYPKASNELIRAIRDIQPTMVFVIGFFFPFLERDVFLELKKEMGFQLFLFDTDSGGMLENYKKLIYFFHYELPLYDQIFSFSKSMTQMMNRLGLSQAQFFPFGSKLITQRSSAKKYDACFIGTPGVRRIFYLETLKDCNITIRGWRWKQFRSLISPELWKKINPESLWGEALYDLLGQTKIVLNITSPFWHAVETGMNLRVFETLAMQEFLLTDFCEELKEMFKIGEEMEVFHSTEELVDKVHFYAKHDNERDKIALAGHEKFLQGYTWEQRVKLLMHAVRDVKD